MHDIRHLVRNSSEGKVENVPNWSLAEYLRQLKYRITISYDYPKYTLSLLSLRNYLGLNYDYVNQNFYYRNSSLYVYVNIYFLKTSCLKGIALVKGGVTFLEISS